VEKARKYHLKVIFFNLIGIPGETLYDFNETVQINRTCLPDTHLTSIFFPYPGTELYDKCEKDGLLGKGVDSRMERKKAILDLPEFPRSKIRKSYVLFDFFVYRGNKSLIEIAIRIIWVLFRRSFYRYISRRPLFKECKNLLIN
jgi:radical SAM superfamily enzyme YgiQ (UPF0313 family)